MTHREAGSNQSDSGGNDASDEGWERLADIVEEYCDSWEAAPPDPELGAFAEKVRQIPGEGFLQLGLIELVKVDLEYRAKEEFQWKPLEDYLAQCPELGPLDSPPAELVFEEYQHRIMHDKTVAVEHYQRRFPGCYNQLLQMVGDDTIEKTVSVFRARNLNDFTLGSTVDDFDLLSKLGRGAFAVVFLARQNSMQRLVALKISADMGLEGQTLAQLDHPHIVRVYDQRTLPKDNLRLMYMQYIAGGSLAEVIKDCHAHQGELSSEIYLRALDQMLDQAGQAKPVDSPNRDWIQDARWSQIVSRIGSQISSALCYAHERQVLHRDLKPANILVDGHGYPKLVDFNVSFSKEVVGATAATFFGGSLAYMSLEQLEAMSPSCKRQADELSGACDVYSLGILLYELLVGRRPFYEPDSFDASSMLFDFVESRTAGLQGAAKKELAGNEYLLVHAIERALEPDAEKRIKPEVLEKQLEWAANSSIDQFLKPDVRGWRSWVSWMPFLTGVVISFVIAIFATWFIISYNLAEAIASNDALLYMWLRRSINIVVFNGGMIALYMLFSKANRILREPDGDYSTQEIQTAIHVNLNFGHWAAILFISLWTIAGVVYPIGLTVGGARLVGTAWLDFIGSHLLAGLTTGAYVFCGVTCCSLAAWHARLVRVAIDKSVWPEFGQELKKLRRRVSFYQILAVATPLASIAVLINWRHTDNTFALGILSSGALAGLAFLSWTLRKINESLGIIDTMNSD